MRVCVCVYVCMCVCLGVSYPDLLNFSAYSYSQYPDILTTNAFGCQLLVKTHIHTHTHTRAHTHTHLLVGCQLFCLINVCSNQLPKCPRIFGVVFWLFGCRKKCEAFCYARFQRRVWHICTFVCISYVCLQV